MPQKHSIHIISPGRTRTYHPRMGSQCNLSWHRPPFHLFSLFITSQRTALCKSKLKMSMQEPSVAVWSVGDAWNMSQMARICMRFVHAEYFSDKSGLRYDMINKQSSHELSSLANQGLSKNFHVTRKLVMWLIVFFFFNVLITIMRLTSVSYAKWKSSWSANRSFKPFQCDKMQNRIPAA